MSDVTISVPTGAKQNTGFINLRRSNKYATYLGWRPAVEGGKPEFSLDSAALSASLDVTGMPAEIRKGQRFTAPIDCSINPRIYWAQLAATPALAQLFDVSLATHYPPGWSGIPEVSLVAREACKRDEIPLAAIYVFLLS